MILRRINAWIGFVTTIILLDHAIFNAVWMLSRGSVVKTASNMPWILFVLMILHVILSIVLLAMSHKGGEKHKFNGYSNLNISTYIQRVSGGFLMIFTVLHVAGTVGILQPPETVHAILPPIFFTITLIHTAISTSKAFVTLGVGNAKFIEILDVIIKIVCGVTLIADMIGFYLYLC